MATPTQSRSGLPPPRSGRPPIRRTPKGPTYAQGRPHPPPGGTPQRTGGRTQQGTSGSRRASTAGPPRPSSASQPAGHRRSSPARQVRRQYNAHVTTNYERVIVAEFVIAVLLVAVAPFTRKNKTGISPYYGQDMVQIVAIMAAYFILGLVAQAGGATARISAWFGGLLLLGIGLGEAAYLAKEFSIFGASTTSSSSSETTTPNNAGAAPVQGT